MSESEHNFSFFLSFWPCVGVGGPGALVMEIWIDESFSPLIFVSYCNKEYFTLLYKFVFFLYRLFEEMSKWSLPK